MRTVSELLKNVPLPQLIRVRQPHGYGDVVNDVYAAVLKTLQESGLARRLSPGMRIAVGIGSRGIADLPDLIRATLDWLRLLGAEPFLVPAMGSHGGGKAERQKHLLAELGISEESMACPIKSGMDVTMMGKAAPDLDVYLDAHAAEADGILVVNRIKPHYCFRAKNESGVVKMLAVGLGKQKGAESCHCLGFENIADRIRKTADFLLEHARILGGIAVVEDMTHKPCLIEAIPAEKMFERDSALLHLAWKKMPLLPLDYERPRSRRQDWDAHVLIVDEMGKNIAGTGMDTNVIGRYTVPFLDSGPKINKIGVLDLTRESEGNAIGMGLADFITERFKDKIDFESVYTNGITSTLLRGSAMPCVLPSDLDVMRAALKTCNESDPDKIRLLRIKNTLELSTLEVSPALIPEMLGKGCAILSEPYFPRFNEAGDIVC
jgi:hypothetical protein